MNNPLPNSLKNVLQNFNITKKFIVKKFFSELPNSKQNILSAILYVTFLLLVFCAYLLVNSNDTSQKQQQTQEQTQKQEQQFEQNQEQKFEFYSGEPKEGVVESAETEALLNYIDFNPKNWDTDRFALSSDGFYCPLEQSTFDYYFIWSKSPKDFLGKFGIKVKTRPISTDHATSQGEIVLVQKMDDHNLFEFYFPTRNELKVKHRYEVIDQSGLKGWDWSNGRNIYAYVKPNTILELEYENSLLVGNTISNVFHTTYIPKDGEDSANVNKDFPYSYPIVDRPSPEDLLGILGIGVDKNSCMKIEKITE